MNWLFLRGLVRDQSHWDHFPAEFESSIPGSKVFCLDLPGMGTESSRLTPLNVESIVQDLRQRWVKLRDQNPGDWSVFSVSLGGMCALHWLNIFKEDFKKAVVINSSASNLSPLLDRFRWPQIYGALRAAMSSDQWGREKFILKMTSQVSKKHRDIIELRKKNARFTTTKSQFMITAARQMQAGAQFNLKARPAVPILILYSEGDRLVSPSCSIALAQFLGAPTRVHPWAGHDLVLDDAAWVIDQVRGWV